MTSCFDCLGFLITTYYYSSLSMESLAPFFLTLFCLAALNILEHYASDYPVAFELCYHCFCT